jgi:hypothetical protein
MAGALVRLALPRSCLRVLQLQRECREPAPVRSPPAARRLVLARMFLGRRHPQAFRLSTHMWRTHVSSASALVTPAGARRAGLSTLSPRIVALDDKAVGIRQSSREPVATALGGEMD